MLNARLGARYRRHLRKCQLAYQQTPPMTSNPTFNNAGAEEQGISGEQVQRLMPTGRVSFAAPPQLQHHSWQFSMLRAKILRLEGYQLFDQPGVWLYCIPV